jgi:hypothetical protein
MARRPRRFHLPSRRLFRPIRLTGLEDRLAPAVATWDGGGADNHWTTAANWVGDVAPHAGDDLVFPAAAAQLANVNDFPDGTAFRSIDVSVHYQLSGNRIALAAGLGVQGASGLVLIQLAVTLTADQTFSSSVSDITSGYNFSGAIDLNGHTLTATGGAAISGPITGTGSLVVSGGSGRTFLAADNTFAGPTIVSQTPLQVDGTLPGPVTVLLSPNGSGQLYGRGTVGDVTVYDQLGAPFYAGGPTLNTGNLSLADTSQTTFVIGGSGTSVAVTGMVQLGGRLVLSPPDRSGLPFRIGDRFTLISNDGSDPVVGTFAGVPEGAVITVGPNLIRVTYRGGDGNDVVATVIAPAVTAFAVGAGAGGLPLVNVYNADGVLLRSFLAYDPAFRGGVRVATADFTGDGVPDIVTAPGPGGGPHIRVFDGVTFALLQQWMAYDPAFRGGVFIATAHLETYSILPDIITGAGAGGGPHVKLFSGSVVRNHIGPIENAGFFAFDPAFRGGVSVAGVDVRPTHDGPLPGRVVVGAGPGGVPLVRVFTVGSVGTTDFFAYDASFRGGVTVAYHGLATAAGATIVTAPTTGGTEVRLFDLTGQQFGGFTPYDPRFLGGITLGVVTSSSFGGFYDTIVTGAGPGGGPHVKLWKPVNNSATLQQEFFAFDPAFRGGVFVG